MAPLFVVITMDDKLKIKVLSISLIGSLVLAGAMSFHTWRYHKDQLIKQTERAGTQNSLDPFSDPFFSSDDPLNTVVSDMHKKMQAMMDQMPHGTNTFSAQSISYNMQETADEYLITIDVPEGQDLDLDTELLDDQLILSAKVTTTSSDQSGGMSRNFSSTSQMKRSMYLSDDIDESAMKIHQEGQTITISIPKK